MVPNSLEDPGYDQKHCYAYFVLFQYLNCSVYGSMDLVSILIAATLGYPAYMIQFYLVVHLALELLILLLFSVVETPYFLLNATVIRVSDIWNGSSLKDRCDQPFCKLFHRCSSCFKRIELTSSPDLFLWRKSGFTTLPLK